MSNFERVRSNCLRASAGELTVAFDIACHEIVRLRDLISAGFIRENPARPVADPKPRPDAIVIEGESQGPL